MSVECQRDRGWAPPSVHDLRGQVRQNERLDRDSHAARSVGILRLSGLPVPNRRPSRPEIRQLLDDIQVGGWVADDPIGNSNIYKCRCHCGDHLEHVHSTPSNPNYAKNKLRHMKRTCWKEER